MSEKDSSMPESVKYSEQQKDIEQVITQAIQQEVPLARAVGGTEAMCAYVDEKWNALDTEKNSAQKQENERHANVQQEIRTLLQKKDRIGLLSKAKDVLDYFFGSFFGSLLGKNKFGADALFEKVKDMPTEVDFDSMDKYKIEITITDLREKIKNESHTFKRLHYIWLMSRAQDALQEKQGNGTKTQYECLQMQLRDGDIILFGNNGNFWNGQLTNKTKDPFAHVGVYHQGKFYHSTMNGSVLHPAGGMEVDMHQYVEQTKPRGYMVMRKNNQEQADRIGKTAQQLVTSGAVKYDQFGAMADINGGGAGAEEKYNCGEFVGKVIETVTGTDVPNNTDALPGTYAHLPDLDPVYMGRYTGQDEKQKQSVSPLV